MAYLACAVIAAAHNAAIHNHCAADTRTECYNERIDTTLALTCRSFADKRTVAVVIDKNGDTEGIAELFYDRLVTERQIARRNDKTVFGVYSARGADADSFNVIFFDKFTAMLYKVLHYLLGRAIFTCGKAKLFGEIEIRIDRRYFNACAANVDT
jgi:hypothetical protein